MPFPPEWISGEKITAMKLNAWNTALAAFEIVSSTAAAALRPYVGFGTAAPQHPVHVNTTEAWKGFRADRSGAPFFAAYSDASGNGELVLSTAAGQNNVVLRASGTSVLSGGNVGIGTASPEVGLHLQGRRLLVHFDDYGNWSVRLRGQKSSSSQWGEYDIIPHWLGLDFNNPQASRLMMRIGAFGEVTVGANLSLPAQTSAPATPAVSAEAKIYVKGGKLVVQYNDAGTVRYKYLDLAGTGVTWVHTTTAP
ncbi:MAG: hypothetical protein KatS3mg005_2038 [Bryobacteraceae bacterium]|nr:MAG: hypothetical protein KatS3mg005_2038 [Bryobacteraceae bacterium]